jgi:ribosomal protein S18 acetylase RimI-like enzyme
VRWITAGGYRRPFYTPAVPVPDYVLRFWRALDRLFESVRTTWWGAVVTDERFPAIWDANYARVEPISGDLAMEEVERELLPDLRSVGATTLHVVSFDHEATAGLISELSARGHALSWDLVMSVSAPPPAAGETVEELAPGASLWETVEASMSLFGVTTADAMAQLRRLEVEVLAPGGKRWFGIRGEDGSVASIAALVVLDGVGYVDNVATFPEARGRGMASALTAHLVREALGDGASDVCLFADPGAASVVRLYERLGFRRVGTLASTKGPLP